MKKREKLSKDINRRITRKIAAKKRKEKKRKIQAGNKRIEYDCN
jgi:hypothetical protein